MKDLFGYQNQGMNYEKFRPKYPSDLLMRAIKSIKNRNRYLDIATGTGQILFQLAHHFQASTGLDISYNMVAICQSKLKQMPEDGNISVARHDFLKWQSAHKYDLITIGQALHWIPIPQFLNKAKSHLHPDGTLAVYGYILKGIQQSTIQPMYRRFYDEKVKKNFDFDRDELHTHYRDSRRYPFEEFFDEVERDWQEVNIPMSKHEFLSYLKTFSGYNTYLERYEDNPLAEMSEKMDEKQQICCQFDYFLILCRNKGG